MKRSKHSLSHYRLQTMDMGKLYPIAWFEALPGDTVQQASSALVRLSPLVSPVMHPVSVRIHHWFVPNRLIWQDWEKFITGGADGLGEGAVWPFVNAQNVATAGSLYDYLGVKPLTATSMEMSALPARAYSLIFNEFYRDEDLVTPRVINKASGGDATTQATVATIAWEKDYFTSARPWPQKGPDVSLPLGVSAPVIPDAVAVAPKWQGPGGVPAGRELQMQVASANATWAGGNPGTLANAFWHTTGLVADLTNATATNVNDVRRAFALQRYQEARAMFGSRYTEYLRYLGVRSSDARLQRPEYLGGGKQTISFSEVLKTGAGEDPAEVIGTMKGHGIAAMRSRRYRRFFEEHGIVMSLCSVRPRTMYMDGLHRSWTRQTKEDYWQKELEQIGQQEVLAKEVFSQADTTGNLTWGYQDRYAEYRHLPSSIAGEFRTLLNYWHLGRSFATAPVLNASFIECDPSKRIFAEQTQNSLWCMFSHSIQARRMVKRAGIGRIM